MGIAAVRAAGRLSVVGGQAGMRRVGRRESPAESVSASSFVTVNGVAEEAPAFADADVLLPPPPLSLGVDEDAVRAELVVTNDRLLAAIVARDWETYVVRGCATPTVTLLICPYFQPAGLLCDNHATCLAVHLPVIHPLLPHPLSAITNLHHFSLPQPQNSRALLPDHVINDVPASVFPWTNALHPCVRACARACVCPRMCVST